MSQRIVLFIPAYNEAEKLGNTLRSVPKELDGRKTEIVVVDDCSTDGTATMAKDFTPHVLVLPENSGVGVATRTGLEYIARRGRCQYVIKFDGDGQHRVELLPEVVEKLKQNDIVICSRFHPLSDQTHTPDDRLLLNMIYTEMLRKITRWKLTDVRSGYMGFHFKDVRAIASKLIVPRYGIPMELLLRVWDLKGRRPDIPVCEIPHPAVYGGDISGKLKKKYSSERIDHKTTRLQMAFEALLMVIKDLKIPREAILEMNGFKSK